MKRAPADTPDPEDNLSAYAGRWVARVGGRVVAHGGTPEEARRAAQAARYKERVEVSFVLPSHLTLPPLVDAVRGALPPDQPLYLVGGALRDALQGRLTHDLDFVVPQGGRRAARRVADALKAAFYPLDDERDIGRVVVTRADGGRDVLDFAAFRGPDLEADLRGRDFTVNALAMDLRSGEIFDPLGGAADLREKRLRACSPSALREDPVRVLRAVRHAAALNLHILPETRQAIRDAAPLLTRVSPERVRDEFFRILESPRPATSLRALDLLDALPHFLPELTEIKNVEQPPPHVSDVWRHTLRVLDHLEGLLALLSPHYDEEMAADLFNGLLVMRLGRYRRQLAEHLATALTPDRSRRALLFLAALYHDVAKPTSKTLDEDGRLRFWGHDKKGAEIASRRARALRLSNEEIAYLKTVIRHHMRVHFLTNRLYRKGKHPSRRAVYRFFRHAAEAGVDIVLLSLADLRATYEHTLSQDHWAACLDVSRTLLENWWERPQEVVSPPPLLNGRDLIEALDLSPGPLVGELLDAVREAQAMGEVSTREEALAFSRRYLSERAGK
ncbi:MAG: HD domain-containing protein [Anaerolineae bacterium]|nr:MAG: HD domain-containing protein [Anaerolineae bacterium]